ncbi:transferase [Seonamhaeicola sp. S2-3]|uniref:acyltransferase n=1 Tax=Seonamhaeicola sp. S2-3 TaxID=1936081 RepID=UPI000972BA60|nr:transferase [Seonamhaeicola sp. S2-3]APY12738.1 transferase [Seonamhaeicola sp. S2-3]
MFPFKIAKKLPVFFYGSVKFTSLSGEIVIDAPIKIGMIGFGQPYEMTTRSRGISEINLSGVLVLKGHIQFGNDFFIYIKENAYCEIGHMSSMATLAKLICTYKVVIGKWVRIGSESQLIDTNFHQMKNTKTGELYPMCNPIELGDYNYIGNRVSIMPKTKTNSYCTVASNSILNKDYTDLGTNILIGGIPSKLIKNDISRDWEGERARIEDFLIFKK